MKSYREILSNKKIYPFEATPYVNKHLEDEVIKANIQWLRSMRIRKMFSYAGWDDALDDLVFELEKELLSPVESESKGN